MRLSEAVKRVLVRLDVEEFVAGWPTLRPGQPAPRSRVEALTLMHAARVLADSIPNKLRRFSHRWLTDRGIKPPISLDILVEPPRHAEASIISVNSSYPEVETAIHGAMRDALLDSESLGDPAPVTRERMQVARHRERRALGLRPLVQG